MPELSLVGLSEDGRSLVLSGGAEETYSVVLDDRLRAAVVSDRVRLGQLELELGAALRPKEIQARVRSGERIEDVAAAAGVSPERIMRYAAPVLSEREHVATQARRSVLRRPEATGPRALAEVVTERLYQRGVEPTSVAWDAWRRDDGKWTVSAAYRSGERQRTALFVYDPLARVVVAYDDEARWLAGEAGRLHGPQPRTSSPRQHGESPRPSAEGRLTIVGSEGRELPELFDQDADDAGAIARAQRAESRDADRRAAEVEDRNPTVTLAPLSGVEDAVEVADQNARDTDGPDVAVADRPASMAFDETHPEPTPAAETLDRKEIPTDLAADEVADLDDETYPTTQDDAAPSSEEVASESAVDTDGEAADAPPARKKAARKRATVPSWDDILFGTKSD
jgi:Protein of unknown function (DUF3071)